MSTTVTLNVTRDGQDWVGIPEGYPGSCMGRSVMELMQEAQAILPFMVCGPDGVAVRDIVVDGVFKRLRSVAGCTDEDGAAVLGISRQRVNQLRNARRDHHGAAPAG
jgi:hypothetical protein